MKAIHVLIIYFIMINLAGFSSMGIDKKRAKRQEWRISEATLFLFAILGGCIGSILGMHIFRHKTKHWYFLFGMPAILILQLILIYFFKTHFDILMM